MKVFITGIGSGLGKGLAEIFVKKRSEVYALGRKIPEDLIGKVTFEKCDLQRLEYISTSLEKLLSNVESLDLIILNAGVLTKLKDIHDTPIYEMEMMMDVNVWANKVILDYIIDRNIKVDQIVAISSGASVNGNRGWHGYSISKASLNMLIKLYSREMEDTHLVSLAPGLIMTPMLEEFVLSSDEEKFPSVRRIKSAIKMTPSEAAEKIYNSLHILKTFDSGSYIDIRNI
ncbi:SDR family NAD(P)-dependent oxidoreductase [Persephonella sp.]